MTPQTALGHQRQQRDTTNGDMQTSQARKSMYVSGVYLSGRKRVYSIRFVHPSNSLHRLPSKKSDCKCTSCASGDCQKCSIRIANVVLRQLQL
jgi:hypothetical protein